VADEVASVVYNGGLVIFPTDTVYGIGCDPYNRAAVDRVFRSKHRPDDKPLTLHLATVAEFLEYAKDNALAVFAAKRLMPGPVTLIVQRPSFIALEVTAGFPTLGFRVPDDPLCQAILERCGPLAATSANVSGERSYRGSGPEERDTLPPADLLIENGPTRYQLESTVIDVSGAQPRVLREGVFSSEQLAERIGPVVLSVMKDRK
jgi:L-threonylcarbamoyladenylate synthase